MKKHLFGMMALAAMVGGCASDKSMSQGQLRPGVMDVTPTPLPALTAAQPVAPVQPVEQPATPASFTGGTAPVLPTSGNYTVQKGDTLYKIARERYGDGKQWQRIASANPGLSPNTLKVGQKIAIP